MGDYGKGGATKKGKNFYSPLSGDIRLACSISRNVSKGFLDEKFL